VPLQLPKRHPYNRSVISLRREWLKCDDLIGAHQGHRAAHPSSLRSGRGRCHQPARWSGRSPSWRHRRPIARWPRRPLLLASAACKTNIARARGTDHRGRVGDRSTDGARRGGPDRQRRRRPSPAMPLLRRPHDYRRDLRAMRRTTRPASPDTGAGLRRHHPPSLPHRTTRLPGNLTSGIASLLPG
jgi:hypothetical protein